MKPLQTRLAVTLPWVLAALLLAAVPTQAAVITWNLVGVTFADGGTATGFFKYDGSTVTDWSISVSGGDTGSFPPTTYNPMTSTIVVFNTGNTGDTFRFSIGMAPSRDLRLTPNAMLTGPGSFDLDLTTMNAQQGNLECFNCTPFRLINAGALVSQASGAIPAPLLDSGGLVVLFLTLSLVAAIKRRSPAHRRLA